MSILIANMIFWPIWVLISHIPYYLTQYTIDNHDKLVFMKHNDGDNT